MTSYHAIQPRAALPEQNPRPLSQQVDGSPSIGKGRKRKAPAHVSQNACTNCKRARAKCDGIEGQSCTRCVSRGISSQCVYELHVKTAKEELVRRVKEMETANVQLKAMLREKDRWIRNVLERFAPGSAGFDVLQSLKKNEKSYQSIVDALSAPPLESWDQILEASDNRESDDDDAMHTDDDSSTSRWTTVISDDRKMNHIMALYFTWVHPACMFFSESMFMDSFVHNDAKFCSPALVNAICALGCRYYVGPAGQENAIPRLGDRFSQQVLVDLKNEQELTPTSAITYAILSLLELSVGQATRASTHMRLAVDALREADLSSWPEDAIQITFYGIHAYNINHAALNYVPPTSPLTPKSKIFRNVKLNPDNELWRDYKHPPDTGNDPLPTHGLETAKELARLSFINLEAIAGWCGKSGKMTAKTIVHIYGEYISWKEALSSSLSRTDGEDLLPHVLQLHIVYAVSICQLFSPLIASRKLEASTTEYIRSILVRSANAGLEVYQNYTQRFSNRYQTPYFAYCLVHLCDIILRHDKAAAKEVIYFCIETLGAALPGFPVVGPLQAMFCETVIACGYKLPKNVELLMGGRSWQSYSREDKLGCCERLTYAQPVDLLATSIDPSLPELFKTEWDHLIEHRGGNDVDGESERSGSEMRGVERIPTTSSQAGSESRGMKITSIIHAPSDGER